MRRSGIVIINDAYNSNPSSFESAVRALSGFKRKTSRSRKILVSGDMLELGKKSRVLHSRAGRFAARSSIDLLITVGPLSKYMAAAAGRAGMKKKDLYPCGNTEDAAVVLKRIMRPGDVVLVKGSRAMAMEKIIEKL